MYKRKNLPCPKTGIVQYFIVFQLILCISNIYPFHLQGDEKTIKITSVPENAGVYIDGIYAGKTNLEFHAAQGLHKIQLKKENYMTLEASIDVQERNNVFNFRLSKNEGFIGLSIYPSDSKVTINDSVYSNSQLSDMSLTPGIYKISVEKDGYFLESDTIKLSTQQRVKKYYSLMKLPELDLIPSENKAELKYLDNTLIKWDEESLKNIPGGNYLLKIRDDNSVKPEFRSSSQSLYLKVLKDKNNIVFSFDKKIQVLSDKENVSFNKDLKIDPFYLNIGQPETKTDKEFTVLLKPRSKTKTVLESALIPGLGQFNNGRKLTGAAFAGAFFGALIWDIINISDYSNSKKILNDKINSYKNESNFTLRYQKSLELNPLYEALSPKYKLASKSHIITGIIYLVNIIDAFFTSSPLKEAVLLSAGSYSDAYSTRPVMPESGYPVSGRIAIKFNL